MVIALRKQALPPNFPSLGVDPVPVKLSHPKRAVFCGRQREVNHAKVTVFC